MEEVLDFNSIPEGYEVAFPIKETPSQRRVRLVEQYAGQIYAALVKANDWKDIESCSTKYAIELTNAVIAATTEEK